jgi:hypothetical protein
MLIIIIIIIIIIEDTCVSISNNKLNIIVGDNER